MVPTTHPTGPHRLRRGLGKAWLRPHDDVGQFEWLRLKLPKILPKRLRWNTGEMVLE